MSNLDRRQAQRNAPDNSRCTCPARSRFRLSPSAATGWPPAAGARWPPPGDSPRPAGPAAGSAWPADPARGHRAPGRAPTLVPQSSASSRASAAAGPACPADPARAACPTAGWPRPSLSDRSAPDASSVVHFSELLVNCPLYLMSLGLCFGWYSGKCLAVYLLLGVCFGLVDLSLYSYLLLCPFR